MHEYNSLHKKATAGATVQARAANGMKAGVLRDNREQPSAASAILQLVRKKNEPHRSWPNKKKTISGHGETLADDLYTVPEGKEITRPAPPGATLGDLSMVLNENNQLSREELLGMIKVNTTNDFWYNKELLRIVLDNEEIKKSEIQKKTIENLLKGIFPKSTDESNSLGELEDQSDFEQWCNSYVLKETFRTFAGGDKMYNMKLTPFTKKENLKKKEKYLRSDNSHKDNEYVEEEKTLSDYVRENDDIHHFMINACSENPNLHFSGFQIDLKEEN